MHGGGTQQSPGKRTLVGVGIRWPRYPGVLSLLLNRVLIYLPDDLLMTRSLTQLYAAICNPWLARLGTTPSFLYSAIC